MLVWAWWAWATVFCAVGCWLLWPVTWIEENWGWGEGVGGESRKGEVMHRAGDGVREYYKEA